MLKNSVKLFSAGPPETDQQAPGAVDTQEPRPLELPVIESAGAGEEVRSEFEEGSTASSMGDYLFYLVNDVHELWSNRMMQAGYSFPNGGFAILTPEEVDDYETECGPVEALDAFYCPFDDQFVLTEELGEQLWDETSDNGEDALAGDFSVGVLAAHQYGHAMQARLGWHNNEPPHEGEKHEHVVEYSALEKHADCLAGIWAQSSYDSSLLEAGHIEKAMNALSGIDDDKLGGSGSPADATERLEAFTTGFESGSTESCDQIAIEAYNR